MATVNNSTNSGKHVMFSYQWDIQELVLKIYEYLTSNGIPVWMDIQGGMKTNLYEGMATAVEDAAVVICFMTPKYQSNHFCQRELKYAADQRKPIIPCLMTPDWNQSDWLGLITAGLIWLDFRDVSNVNLDKKLQRLTNFIDIITGDTFKTEQKQLPTILDTHIAQAETIRMIIIGRRGIGKSSLGNTILGERQFDITISSHSAISNQCKVGFRNLSRENKNLIVIDTPGFETNQEEIERSIQVTITGKTHVLLLVLDLDQGVTIEEEKFIELLIRTYGKVLFQYFIVVFTFIEQIQDEIDSLINERNIPVLKSLLEQCNKRYIAVNNNANSDEKEIFLTKLMKIISTMNIRNDENSESDAFKSGCCEKILTKFQKKVK